jgi:Ca2+-binding EF-hand superfamily protein
MIRIDEEEESLRATFLRYDDGDQALTISELKNALSALDVHCSNVDLKKLLASVDADHSGKLSFVEFRAIFDSANLLSAFNEMDKDHGGSITESELKGALQLLGHKVTESQVKGMLRQVDLDNDGTVSFEEFKAAFKFVPLASLDGIALKWFSLSSMDVGTDLAPPIPPKNIPMWQFLCAAGIGGVASRTFTAPLERIKIKAQTIGVQSVQNEFQQIIAKEGFGGLFAGNFANCLRAFPMAGIAACTYVGLLRILPCDNELDPMEPVYRAFAGASCGIVATVCTYPLDVVRTRLTMEAVQHGTGVTGVISATRYVCSERIAT